MWIWTNVRSLEQKYTKKPYMLNIGWIHYAVYRLGGGGDGVGGGDGPAIGDGAEGG